MSSTPEHPPKDYRSTSLLGQSSLCLLHGGASLLFDETARYNTVRFEFLVDAGSCRPHQHKLFSVAIRHNEHVTATVQSCAYPASNGRACLTVQLSGQSFSTSISCGAWLSIELRITHSSTICVNCSQFNLSVLISESLFNLSCDFPQKHFCGALQLGSQSPDEASQPALFRSIFAEVSPHMCTQCRLSLRGCAASAAEPGFSAPLPQRCRPLELEGSCCH
jgi:hypothetical protein